MTEIDEPSDVLLVDDRPENLIALRALLTVPSLRILVANSGTEALAIAAQHDLAVILLDVQMPGMDGFETATRLREIDTQKRVPIIFVTAISRDQEHMFQGYSCGAVDYLFKPLTPFVVRSKVRVFAELHQQQRKLAAAAQHIFNLQQMLPICSGCKSVRNDDGYWSSIETYLAQHTGADLTHGYCPTCLELAKSKVGKLNHSTTVNTNA